VATLLLDRGATVDKSDVRGETPLAAACDRGCVEAARICLDRGADVNKVSDFIFTPLYVACANGHVGAARLCLERGATLHRRAGPYRRTPLEVARLGPHETLAAWLETVVAVGWTRYLSEPRYKLALLRQLAARGDARRERAFHGKELLLYLLFPSGHSRGHPRLPDELFAVIVRYYWGGGLSVEEEAAAAAETAEREAEWAAFAESNESEDSAGDYQ